MTEKLFVIREAKYIIKYNIKRSYVKLYATLYYIEKSVKYRKHEYLAGWLKKCKSRENLQLYCTPARVYALIYRRPSTKDERITARL